MSDEKLFEVRFKDQREMNEYMMNHIRHLTQRYANIGLEIVSLECHIKSILKRLKKLEDKQDE